MRNELVASKKAASPSASHGSGLNMYTTLAYLKAVTDDTNTMELPRCRCGKASLTSSTAACKVVAIVSVHHSMGKNKQTRAEYSQAHCNSP